MRKTVPKTLCLAQDHRGSFVYLLFLSALVMAILISSPLFAQDRVITLDEAYKTAVDNHEAVKIAGEAVSQAQSNLDKTTARILPNLTVEGTYTRYNEQKSSGSFVTQPEDNSKVDIRVTQPLYTGGREWANRRQARALIEKSKEGVELSTENVLRATARAYFGLLKAQKDVEIKDAALKRADERRKVADARFKVGEVTRSAVLRAEAELAGAEAELITSKSNLLDARNNLKRILGVTEDFAVVEPAQHGSVEGDTETLVKRALDSRNDYKQSILDQRVASEGITFAKGNFYPQLKLEGLYSWRDQNPQTTFFQEDSLSASLILTYPIFEGGLRRAEVAEARSKFREAEFRKLGLRRDIEIEVRDAINNVESFRAVIDSFTKQVSFAEEDYRMVFEQFKFGIATTVEVIDSDTTLVQAQRSLANAAYDLQLSIIELKYRLGILAQDAGFTEKSPK